MAIALARIRARCADRIGDAAPGAAALRRRRGRPCRPPLLQGIQGDGEPEDVAAVARNLNNLFEMPTVFYAGTAIAFAAGEAGALLVSLGWAYVALRVLHSAIHLSTNRVLWRFRAFAASWLVLIAYWVVLGIGLRISGSSELQPADTARSTGRGRRLLESVRCSARSSPAPSGRSRC